MPTGTAEESAILCDEEELDRRRHRPSSPWKNGCGRRVRLSAAGVRFANGGRESLDRGLAVRGPLKSLGCRSQRDRRSRKSRGAVCGVAAPPRCASASPSSRLLASDPAALATPPTPFFSNLLLGEHDLRLHEADLARSQRSHLAQGDDFFGGSQKRDPVPLLCGETAKRDRLSLAYFPGFERGEPETFEGEGDLRERDRVRRPETLLQGHPFEDFERHGVGDVELSDACPSERLQVRTRPELLAELARDRAHVGSRGTGDRKGEPSRFVQAAEREMRDADLLGQDGNGLSAPRHLVELLSPHFLGRVGRGRLEELSAEGRRRALDVLLPDAAGVALGSDGLSLAVIGRGGAAQPDHALVGLVHPREKTLQARRAASAKEKRTRRHRVERRAVPDSGKRRRVAYAFDDVVGGEPPGFVDEKEEPALERVCQGSSFRGGKTCASSSSTRAPRSSERSATKWSSGA